MTAAIRLSQAVSDLLSVDGVRRPTRRFASSQAVRVPVLKSGEASSAESKWIILQNYQCVTERWLDGLQAGSMQRGILLAPGEPLDGKIRAPCADCFIRTGFCRPFCLEATLPRQDISAEMTGAMGMRRCAKYW